MTAKKLYYKIGEACKLLDIQPYVLRYWETEFSPLNPTKSKSGQRVYAEQDLRIIRRIKELLYDEGYTIAGAKKKLESEELVTVEPAAEEASEPAPKRPTRKKAARRRAPARGKAAASADPGEALREGIRKALDEVREIEALLGGE